MLKLNEVRMNYGYRFCSIALAALVPTGLIAFPGFSQVPAGKTEADRENVFTVSSAIELKSLGQANAITGKSPPRRKVFFVLTPIRTTACEQSGY